MPIFGPANHRIDPQIDILIDRLCTERDRNNPARKIYLSDNAQKIKRCVAGYTSFNLMHRVTEFVKSFFGISDWQRARDALFQSLVGRNFTIFVNDQASAAADKILGPLAKSNEQNLLVSPILSYDRALKIVNDELINIGPDRFELGQYEFNVIRVSGNSLTLSSPRLLFN
jgi:hypothetical protein